jgi:hypothetical protein
MARPAIHRPAGALLLLAALGAPPLQVAHSARLRNQAEGPNATNVQALVAVRRDDPGGDIPTPKEIHAKWDKMDEFLEIMFVMACKWKHGKEVHEAAAHAYKDGKIEGEDLEKFKKQTQAQNLVELKTACGGIVARGAGKCRQSCADRWGTAAEDRHECDEKCVTSYANFEKDCTSKADSLELVYEMRLKAAAARKQCHEGYCAEFPSVWLKKKEDMKAEADTRCDDYCKEAKLVERCENRWALQVDMVYPSVESGCHNSSTEVQACFSEKSQAASGEEETCQSSGKSSCEQAEATCKTEGKVSESAAEAAAFCQERRKMCEKQVIDHCLADHKKALEASKKECEEADKEAIDKCVEETMGKKKQSAQSECEEEKKESCPKECGAKCNTEKLADCLEGLESESDAAEVFCTDFWKLLHSSSQIDPETGNPIVLLDPLAIRNSTVV